MKIIAGFLLAFLANQTLACEMKYTSGAWWYICPNNPCCQKWVGSWKQQCGGCPGNPGGHSGGGHGGSGSLKIMSYNVYGWNALGQNSWKAPNVYR